MEARLTGKRMSKEAAKLLGLPFTSDNWGAVYRFVQGGARIERVCYKPGYNDRGRLHGATVERRIRYLLSELDDVQLVEIEGDSTDGIQE